MGYEEFRKKLRLEKAFDKYIYGLFAITIIIFMMYAMIFKLYPTSQQMNNIRIVGIILILLGAITLVKVIKIDKFRILENNFTLEQNKLVLKHAVFNLSKIDLKENSIAFTYFKDNMWRSPYRVYLFADDYYIAINVNLDYKGILDFGYSARMQKSIVNMLEAQYSSIKK
jgi:hypothetical protein